MHNNHIPADLLDAIEHNIRILQAKRQFVGTLQRLGEIAAKSGDIAQLDHLRSEMSRETHLINLTTSELAGQFRQALNLSE